MSSSNGCFLTCIQISQEAGQVVWYSYLFKNFPQFVVIHTVKGFGLVNKAEIDVFLELSRFFNDPKDVGNLISGSSDSSKGGKPGVLQSMRLQRVRHNLGTEPEKKKKEKHREIYVYMRAFPGSSAGKESTYNAGDPSSIPGLARSPGERRGYPLQYSWASLVAQMVKNQPAMRETWVQSLGWENP